MPLERIASPRRRWRHVARLTGAVAVGLGAVAAHALIARPDPVRVTAVALPAPPIVIAMPAPPPVVVAPPPVAPPPAVVPPAHVGCAADVSSIGVPIARAELDVNAPQLSEVSVSSEGCTIAVRVGSTLDVSWDGGTSFTQVDAARMIAMVAADGRVRLLRDDGMLGTLVPDHAIEWRAVPATLAKSTLIAGGPWIALADAALAGVSDDDGATWRYIELPKHVAVTRIDAGRLIGFGVVPTSEPDGEHIVDYRATTFAADLRSPRWHAIGTVNGTPADEAGRYERMGDQFWGCGASEKLVTKDGVTVAAGLRDDVWPIAVHTGGGVTFATLQDRLSRLDGAGLVDLGDMPDGRLVAVDPAGTPIVQTPTQLLRWSKAGGWRVLLDNARGGELGSAASGSATL